MKLISSLLIFLSVSTALASDKGNGGGGVECREANGSLSLVTLDYYEAREKRLLPQLDSHDQTAISKFVTAALVKRTGWNSSNLDSANLARVTAQESAPLDAFLAASDENIDLGNWHNTQIVFDKNPIPLTNDYGSVHLAPNCHLIQIAVDHDGTASFDADMKYKPAVARLEIDLSQFRRLDYFNRAFLYVHELTYADQRGERGPFGVNFRPSIVSALPTGSDKNSKLSRTVVEVMLSKTGLPTPIYPTLQDKQSNICSDDVSPSDFKRLGLSLVNRFLASSGPSPLGGTRLNIDHVSRFEKSIGLNLVADFTSLQLSNLYSTTFDVRAEIVFEGVAPTGVYLNLRRQNAGDNIEYWLSDVHGSALGANPVSQIRCGRSVDEAVESFQRLQFQ